MNRNLIKPEHIAIDSAKIPDINTIEGCLEKQYDIQRKFNEAQEALAHVKTLPDCTMETIKLIEDAINMYRELYTKYEQRIIYLRTMGQNISQL